MKETLINKEKINKVKKELRKHIVFTIFGSLVFVATIVVLGILTNKNNYKILVLIMSILIALLVGFLLFMIRLEILQDKANIDIMNRVIINDVDKRVGVFTKKDNKIYFYKNTYVYKYIFRSNNKDYDIYFNCFVKLNIVLEKQYLIEELNEYLVSFEEHKDEK